MSASVLAVGANPGPTLTPAPKDALSVKVDNVAQAVHLHVVAPKAPLEISEEVLAINAGSQLVFLASGNGVSKGFIDILYSKLASKIPSNYFRNAIKLLFANGLFKASIMQAILARHVFGDVPLEFFKILNQMEEERLKTKSDSAPKPTPQPATLGVGVRIEGEDVESDDDDDVMEILALGRTSHMGIQGVTVQARIEDDDFFAQRAHTSTPNFNSSEYLNSLGEDLVNNASKGSRWQVSQTLSLPNSENIPLKHRCDAVAAAIRSGDRQMVQQLFFDTFSLSCVPSEDPTKRKPFNSKEEFLEWLEQVD